MRRLIGRALNHFIPTTGIITHNPLKVFREDYILATNNSALFISSGFGGIVTTCKNLQLSSSQPIITVSASEFDLLNDGDCVHIDQDGLIAILWESQCDTNSILLTEVCDCRCQMCPQPPKPHNNETFNIAKRLISIIKPSPSQSICITGGEPTLLKRDFIDILGLIKSTHPKTPILLLSNGKSFVDFEFTRQFIQAASRDFTTCISLHSDICDIHDLIVGSKGSFYKTLMGLQNLARYRARIEIRIVINKLNADHLESIANFIYRNFPFIFHCAFMGLEITGAALTNYNTVWIDPVNYKDQLSNAVRTLSRSDINVSIYNIPLCLLNQDMWGFARQSISLWKNEYLPMCSGCRVKADCCGVFVTSGPHNSPNISALI